MMDNRNHKLLFFLVGIILLFHGSIFASLKFERFSNKEGFNQNTINAIVEDKYGFLWFGTPNGLIKYDGYEFFSFTNNPLDSNSISNNNISCLFTDNSGIMWIGTKEGVNVYLPQYERFLAVPLDQNIFVSHIATDPEGRIWISGEDALFACKINDTQSDISFEVSDNLLKSEFNTILPKTFQ